LPPPVEPVPDPKLTREIHLVSTLDRHLGHSGISPVYTRVSNCSLQSLQTNSHIGTLYLKDSYKLKVLSVKFWYNTLTYTLKLIT